MSLARLSSWRLLGLAGVLLWGCSADDGPASGGPGADAGDVDGGGSDAGTDDGGTEDGGTEDGGPIDEQELCGFLPVVPGARGYGVEGPIARGMPIYRVTTTAATGTGSFAEAVAAADDGGGGIILFETSGVIDIESAGGTLTVSASNLWIAGQSAPAPGIFVRGGLIIRGADVLVQHLGVYRPLQNAQQSDTISLYGTNSGADPGRTVLDHVALWGANDGNLDIAHYGGGSVTVQHSIIGPPLIGGHPEGDGHNFNSLIYGSDTGMARITLRGNLYTTARDRQPLSSFDELVMVNNVLYNREPTVGRYIYLRNRYQNDHHSLNSIVGNVFWDTSEPFGALPVLLRPHSDSAGLLTTTRIHLDDNFWNLADPPVSEDPWSVLVTANDNPPDPISAAEPPVWNTCLEAAPSPQILEAVRAQVGPRPTERIPFLAELTAELGAAASHPFPQDLADISGELSGLEENQHTLDVPADPHALEPNDRTAIENLLHDMAAALEGSPP